MVIDTSALVAILSLEPEAEYGDSAFKCIVRLQKALLNALSP